ncbi:hypothetical protein F4801DRAFT_581528 [Xylaria longipes]|nr:hypothetical protein F4801DRAFT_581528 [Xylaria longipes]RYC66131.1 hypothetical protein CHU98_g83 [Xylaria longipes]
MAAAAKSAAGEAPSKDKDKDEIIVILRPRNPSSIPKRRLVLTPTRPAVSIGRSSKDHSKGFVPADDNAWLENPVMSREHAELFAKFDDNPRAIYLKDVNSFHGTYLTTSDGCNKGRQIVPNEPVKLTHGDTIQFGIDIFRSSKTYPPCSVDFLVEAMNQKADDDLPLPPPPRSFTVPDDVDDEEDEDCENEDDLTITAVHTRSDPIDLTRVWSPAVADLLTVGKLRTTSTINGNTSSNAIDLTSEVATCQSDVEPCTIGQGTPRPCESIIGSPVPSVSSLSEGDHSPQARMRLSHTSDGRIVVIQSPLPVPSDAGEIYHHHDFSDEDMSSELGEYSESDPDASSEFTEEMSELGGADDLSRVYDDTSEIAEIGDDDELSDDYAEDFDDSDCPFPDPYDDESVGSLSSDEEEDEEEDEQDATTESSNNKPRMETPVLNVPETVHHETGAMPFFTMLPVFSPQRQLELQLDFYKPSHDRDPSPSDAALFKRRPLLDPFPNDSRAQQLGEKSGKFEFFAARERNRATVNQDDSTAPSAAILETPGDDKEISFGTQSDGDNDPVATAVSNASRSVSPSLSCAPETVATAEETEDNFEAPDTSSIKLGDNDTHQYSAWSASGDRFINNPPNEPSSTCQTVLGGPPAEFDMTSAYTFQQSKLATAAETVSKTRRLPIEDLLAQEPKRCSIASQPVPEATALGDSSTSCAPTPKRSHEEAFNQSDDTTSKCAERIIARCFSRVVRAKDQDRTPREDAREDVVDIAAMPRYTEALMTTVEEHDTPKHESTVILVEPEASRPAKRMRLATAAAQVVACVALGSAATFSYLVNTAPVL